MKIGHFYFISDKYFEDFKDSGLMKNRDAGDRPCFYAILDSIHNIYWMIPISSKIDKYRNIYSKNVSKYGVCDTIVFGKFLGKEKAFLIQNICPVVDKYIENEYVYEKNIPITIDKKLEKIISRKANLVLKLVRRGRKLVFPDILKIENKLIETLS